MTRRSLYGSKLEVIYGRDGSKHQIYLDKNAGVFTVEIDGEPVQSNSLQKVKDRACLVLEIKQQFALIEKD